MKRLSLLGLSVLLLSATGGAFACDRGDRIDHRLDRAGDRREAQWDRRGDRVDRRWDRRH